MPRISTALLVFLTSAACGPTVALDSTADGGSGTGATSTSTSTPMATSPVSTSAATRAETTVAPPSSTGTTTDEPPPPPIDGDWGWIPDAPPCGPSGPQGRPGANLEYLWVASTAEGTLSKIDTLTLVELARYLTAPIPSGPSQVSVALSGDVAVANEAGGIAKFHAIDCPGPGSTSTGPGDVYPFGRDGCMAWFLPAMAETQPVAWAPGTFDPVSCQWEDELLWATESFGGDVVDVHLLDGETGATAATATIEGYPMGPGPRFAAVDGAGNLWLSREGMGPLVRVDGQTLDVQSWLLPVPSAGLAVDPMQGIWSCGPAGLARFDPGFETFLQLDPMALGLGQVSGCTTDDSWLWLAGLDGVWALGLDSLVVELSSVLPDPVQGVAVDFQGALWFVAPGADRVHRLLPRLLQVDTVEGLQGPTTASDMTGHALAHVLN